MGRIPRLFQTALIVFIGGFLAACMSVPPTPPPSSTVETNPGGSCGLMLPEPASIDDRVTAVIAAEGALIEDQDIDALMGLWTTDAMVINARNTPMNSADDQIWEGTDALRHRYRYWVFPSRPSIAEPQNLIIHAVDGSATITSTTRINNEIAPGGDLWELREVDGCWLIAKLTYNLEP